MLYIVSENGEYKYPIFLEVNVAKLETRERTQSPMDFLIQAIVYI